MVPMNELYNDKELFGDDYKYNDYIFKVRKGIDLKIKLEGKDHILVVQ